MSYSISYRKCIFTNAEGLVIPIIEVGDNNVYEVSWNGGNGPRARDWNIQNKLVHHWTVQKKEAEAYMKSCIQHYIDREEEHELTEDNWKEANAQYWASWRFPGKGTLGSAISYLSNTNIDHDIAKENIKIFGKDIDDLTIQDFRNKEKSRVSPLEISGVESALHYQKQRNKQKAMANKKNKEPVDPYRTRRVVKIDTGYAMKMSSRRCRYCYNASSGKKFDTASKAQAWADKLNKRFANINACIEQYTLKNAYATA